MNIIKLLCIFTLSVLSACSTPTSNQKAAQASSVYTEPTQAVVYLHGPSANKNALR